ncbi:MAG: rod shape-determining protein MreC [Acidobacteria bacterium]|nr:MAG: rod shape-determining protein MreC [Acidobacteriota bacterium]
MAAQILLLALQIRRGQQVRLIRVWAIESVSPLGRGAAWSVDGVRGLWNSYVALRHLREEDDQLRTEVGALRMHNAQLESRAAEADRLAGLLGFRDAHAEVQMLAARVIGASPDPSSHMVFISRGSRDGVRRDMGVITPEGVVGKVFAVYPDTSQVLLLTDKESGVGALLGESRAQGPVRGTGEPLLGLEYINNDIKVEPGERILTSGQDRIFPKDLPVGTVTQVQPDRHSPFLKISVKPTARLDGLEEVLVLLTRQEFAFRKDGEKSVPVPVAPATSPKPAAPVTPPKPAAPLSPPKPAASVTPPKPAATVAPAAPPAPNNP